jgi:hypothetical protein
MTLINDTERAAIDEVLRESWRNHESKYRDDSLDGQVVYEDSEVVAMDFNTGESRDLVYDDLEIDLPHRVFANVMVQDARECDPDHHWVFPLVFPKEVQD